MKKSKKRGCIIAAAVFLFGAIGFVGPRYYFWGDDSGYMSGMYRAKPLTLKEQPEQVTIETLDDAGAEYYDYEGQLYSVDGEFVPFSIRSKKSAYRAALACADLIGLGENCTLRYSPYSSETYSMIIPFYMGKIYDFVQYYGEIPVWEGNVSVWASFWGTPKSLNCNVIRDLPDGLPTEPKLTVEEAKRAAAKAFMQKTAKSQEPLLMIARDDSGTPILAWVVFFDEYSYTAMVNAMTGEVSKENYGEYLDIIDKVYEAETSETTGITTKELES